MSKDSSNWIVKVKFNDKRKHAYARMLYAGTYVWMSELEDATAMTKQDAVRSAYALNTTCYSLDPTFSEAIPMKLSWWNIMLHKVHIG